MKKANRVLLSGGNSKESSSSLGARTHAKLFKLP